MLSHFFAYHCKFSPSIQRLPDSFESSNTDEPMYLSLERSERISLLSLIQLICPQPLAFCLAIRSRQPASCTTDSHLPDIIRNMRCPVTGRSLCSAEFSRRLVLRPAFVAIRRPTHRTSKSASQTRIPELSVFSHLEDESFFSQGIVSVQSQVL